MREFTEESLMSAKAAAQPPQGRIIFAGTPEVAAVALRSLLDSGAEVAGVLTRPDAPVGRRRRLTPSPVAQTAEEVGLPVIRAAEVDEEVVTQLRELEAELGVVVAYGALLPQHALDALPRGWVNLHYSRLPRHRGAAPVQHAILAGDEATAATVFQLERGMDTGPVHGLCDHPLPRDRSAGAVLTELTHLGAALLTVLLPDILAGRSASEPQQGEPSLAPKLTRENAFIDPTAPADEVVRRINATIPEPGAWTLHGTDRIKLGVAELLEGDLPEDLAAEPAGTVSQFSPPGNQSTAHQNTEDQSTAHQSTAHQSTAHENTVVLRAGEDGAVVLSAVQPAGKRMMNAADWLRGQQEPVVLGSREGEQ